MERKCKSCNVKLMVVKNSTNFPCPECGETISRCGDCRERVRKYECECGFEGP